MPGEPNAQAPNTPAPEGGQPGTDEKSGIQKRIDELTASLRETQRIAESKDQMIAEMTSTITNLMQQSREAPAPRQEPEVEVDPDVAKVVNALMDRKLGSELAQIKATLAEISGQMYVSRQPPAIAIAKQDPKVAQLAKKFADDWSRNPAQRGFHPDDAVVFALGMQVLKGELDAQKFARTGGNGFEPLSGHSPAPQPQPDNSMAMPPDFSSWPIQRQEAWMDANQDKIKPF